MTTARTVPVTTEMDGDERAHVEPVTQAAASDKNLSLVRARRMPYQPAPIITAK